MLSDERIFSENVRYNVAHFNRLGVRKIRLPHLGRGNIIYLLSDSFENTLKMITSGSFIIPPNYRKVFYPWIAFGSFMGRRYRFNLNKLRTQRVSQIKELGLVAYNNRRLMSIPENIFFSAGDLFENILPIIRRFPIKRIYTEFFKSFDDIIFTQMTPEPMKEGANEDWNNRIMIIDSEAFKFKMGASLEDNKTNPLFLIFLTFLRTKSLSTLQIDRDLLITSKNLFLKFNPSKTSAADWPRFRLALFRIMNANLDEYVDKLSEEDRASLDDTSSDKITKSIIRDSLSPYTKNVSMTTAETLTNAVDTAIKKKVLTTAAINQIVTHDQKEISKTLKTKSAINDVRENPTKSIINTNPYVPISKDRERLFNAMVKDYTPLAEDEKRSPSIGNIIDKYKETIADDVNDILAEEEVKEEISTEIQDKIAPMRKLKKAPVSSSRDLKLREEQKKIVVRSSTIGEILERDASNVPIQTTSKAKVMKSTNDNMKTLTFANFEKTYLDNVYTRDLVNCFDMLKDKDSPFFITGIDVKDTSTIMDLKETWTVSLVDENNKKHTMKVDIPKFYDNRFMIIGGNKYLILKQNMYNPVVKDTPNTVIITTNYNKISVERKATRSLSTVERIFTLIRKTGDNKTFIQGDSTRSNLNKQYINSLEYDELSRRLFKFSSNGCELYFSREYIQRDLVDQIPKGVKGDEYFIGVERGVPIIINEDSGKDRSGRTIAEIIEANLTDEYKALFNSIKPPRTSMYATGKLAYQFIPIGITLVVWLGITKTLNELGIDWKFNSNMKRVPQNTSTSNYIKFADGVLEYQSKTYAELILNGLMDLKPEKLTFESLNSEEGYVDYLYSVWGNHSGLTQLRHFYEFLVDPITKEVCQDYSLPTTPEGLLVYSVKLLADNQHVSKSDDRSYRVRSIEMIPGILYEEIARQYAQYVKSGRRIPMTLRPRAVIMKLQAEKTLEEYSTLNPATELGRSYVISAKGHKGTNLDWAYDEKKRSYDPTSIGKLSMSTSADAGVGVTRYLALEPTITNARGYRAPVEDIDALKDTNLCSPVELMTPGTISLEDPHRSSIY